MPPYNKPKQPQDRLKVTVTNIQNGGVRVRVETKFMREEITTALLGLSGVEVVCKDYTNTLSDNETVYEMSLTPGLLNTGWGPNVAMAIRSATERSIDLVVTNGGK